MYRTIAALGLLVTLAGCDSSNNPASKDAKAADPTQATATPAVPSPQPVAVPVTPPQQDPAQVAIQSFEPFARTVVAEMKRKYGGQQNLKGSNGEVFPTTVTISDDFKFDVQKSDSLLAPFKGYLVVPMRTVSKVRNLEVPHDTTVKLECAFKDGQWVLETDISRAFNK